VIGLVFVTLLERFRPARVYRDYWPRQFLQDLGAFAIVAVCSKLVDPTLRFFSSALSFLRLEVWGDSVAIKVVGCLVLGDLLQYWVHRGMHSYSRLGTLLWPTHRWHHEPRAVTALAGYRGSIMHRLLFGLALLVIPGVIFDLRSPLAFAVITGYNILHELVLHANANIHFGPLSWLIATPAWHRVHHARDAELQGSNFGGRLTIWDRMFGTYKPAEALGAGAPIGIDEPQTRSRWAVILGV
jgi:sterol desaturase/sphingolipid hydroxylase (fatty acid hydroxylase superfamily)